MTLQELKEWVVFFEFYYDYDVEFYQEPGYENGIPKEKWDYKTQYKNIRGKWYRHEPGLAFYVNDKNNLVMSNATPKEFYRGMEEVKTYQENLDEDFAALFGEIGEWEWYIEQKFVPEMKNEKVSWFKM